MKKENKLPDFDQLKEMVNFWDNHDFTDFKDEFKEITDLKFDFKNRYYLPITIDMYESMEDIAQKKGITVEKLMRNWMEEKLTDSIEV
jgi:hypothetical protein